MENQIQGRAVCTDVTHNHETLEAAGNCGDPMIASERPALPIAGVTLAALSQKPATDDFRQWPEVRERMRLQYDAQSRILDRIADDMELYLPDSSYTAEFYLRFAQLRQEVAEQIEAWQ